MARDDRKGRAACSSHGSDGATPYHNRKNSLMKVWHFLQVSSEIIGKQRYRSNLTAMASSADLQIAVSLTTKQASAPSYFLGHSRARTERVILPAQLREPITEHERAQFEHTTHPGRSGMHQVVEE